MVKPLNWADPSTMDDFISIINEADYLPTTTAIFIRDKVYRSLSQQDYVDLLTELIPHFKSGNKEV